MGSRRLSSESIFSTATSLGRSRTWSDDIQKHWNLPALSSETTDQRIARYSEYFRIQDEQLRYIYGEFLKELDNIKADDISNKYASSGPALLDSLVDTLPTGRERGVGYALDFSGAIINVVKSTLDGAHNIETVSHSINLKRVSSEHKKGLLDANSGAIHFFDTAATAVKHLLQKCEEKRALSPSSSKNRDSYKATSKPEVPIGFSVAFPLDQVDLSSASIIEWTKEFETGRNTCDPVEGMDLATLLDMALWRQQLHAKTSHVINDSTALLLAGMYERKINQPPCVASFIINNGLNGAYVDPKAGKYGYKGKIIDTQLGRLDKSLPVTDVDLEVDFADEGGRGKQVFEKLIGIVYLGECCRRLIVKVWQDKAPALAWARHSFPTHAAAACVSDSTPTLDLVDVYVSSLWGLETDFETRITIQKLFTLVFERSAGLAAAAIAALAKKTGRLTPAMGGVTVAVEPFIKNFPWYEEIIMRRIANLVGDLAEHIKLMPIENGPGKGSCILDVIRQGC